MKVHQPRNNYETQALRIKKGTIHDLTWTMICIIPFLILLYLVASYGVNVPFWDQWKLPSLFEKVFEGDISFQDFFVPYNEHRLFFPRFIFIALAFLTHWNTKYEMYFSILLMIFSYVLIHQIYSRKIVVKDKKFWLISLSISIILTSFIQMGNFLFGFQIAWFLINFCLILAIFLLTSQINSIRLKISLGAIACIIASFSSAHGLMTWLAVLPCILTLAHESNQTRTISVIKVVLCWVILFLSSCLAYFHNYQNLSDHPDVLLFVKQDLDVSLNYFFSLLGNPLLAGSNLSWLFGLMISVNFFWFFIRYLRNPYSEFSCQASPWFSMGLFSFLFALITTIGRSGGGVAPAYTSRYTSETILLIIALVQLWQLESFKLPNYRWKCLVITTILTVFVSISSINQIPFAQEVRLDGEWFRSCLEISESVDSGLDHCLERMYPDPKYVREQAKVLNKIGFRQDPDSLNFIDAQNNFYGFLDSPRDPEQALLIKKTCLNCVQEISFTGWAILPNELKPASLVLISHSSDKSEQETVLEAVTVRLPSPDVAEALQSERYAKARWSAAVPIKQLPLGETTLKAWVYDGKGKKFIKLGGIKARVE